MQNLVTEVFGPIRTPAFVYDGRVLLESIHFMDKVRAKAGVKLLYAMKPCSLHKALLQMAPLLDGFSASSLFEARLANEVLGEPGTVHLTSPGLNPSDAPELSKLVGFVSFNSLSQLERMGSAFPESAVGIRVNPGLNFIDEPRYAPSGPGSRLGISFARLARGPVPKVSGVLFHTNCEATDFRQLLETVRRVTSKVPDLLEGATWINLGGGYYFEEADDLEPFYQAIDLIHQRFPRLTVYIEPGSSLIRRCVSLIATVVDVIDQSSTPTLILDASVNHLPEVLEYQYSPDVLGTNGGGKFEYVLSGPTCLAGDTFGRYKFDEELTVGSQVIFKDVGAYSMVKMHSFNGVPMASIYEVDESGLLPIRSFTYQEFLHQLGGHSRAPV